ncbi:unnamed protein product [Lampetra fluviatilis]
MNSEGDEGSGECQLTPSRPGQLSSESRRGQTACERHRIPGGRSRAKRQLGRFARMSLRSARSDSAIARDRRCQIAIRVQSRSAAVKAYARACVRAQISEPRRCTACTLGSFATAALTGRTNGRRRVPPPTHVGHAACTVGAVRAAALPAENVGLPDGTGTGGSPTTFSTRCRFSPLECRQRAAEQNESVSALRHGGSI